MHFVTKEERSGILRLAFCKIDMHYTYRTRIEEMFILFSMHIDKILQLQKKLFLKRCEFGKRNMKSCYNSNNKKPNFQLTLATLQSFLIN